MNAKKNERSGLVMKQQTADRFTIMVTRVSGAMRILDLSDQDFFKEVADYVEAVTEKAQSGKPVGPSLVRDGNRLLRMLIESTAPTALPLVV